MKKELDTIADKLETLDRRLDSIDTKMAVYNEQLKIHIKRTTLIEMDLQPIKDHVSQVKGAGKFITYTGVTVTIITAIAAALISFINGSS